MVIPLPVQASLPAFLYNAMYPVVRVIAFISGVKQVYVSMHKNAVVPNPIVWLSFDEAGCGGDCDNVTGDVGWSCSGYGVDVSPSCCCWSSDGCGCGVRAMVGVRWW